MYYLPYKGAFNRQRLAHPKKQILLVILLVIGLHLWCQTCLRSDPDNVSSLQAVSGQGYEGLQW